MPFKITNYTNRQGNMNDNKREDIVEINPFDPTINVSIQVT